LQAEEMLEPNNNQWLDIANKFYMKTNFPNLVGAVDGKHIRCINPKNSGSMFFNYKKYFSILLMAVVDSEYCFEKAILQCLKIVRLEKNFILTN